MKYSKTKFSPLIDITKKKIEELNIKLVNIKEEISKQKYAIAQLKEEFYNSKTPKEGKIAFFAAKQLMHIAFKQELNLLEEILQNLKFQESEIINKIKQQNLELEKFKILHQDEINKKLKALKKKEDNFMDEIGSIRHTFLGVG